MNSTTRYQQQPAHHQDGNLPLEQQQQQHQQQQQDNTDHMDHTNYVSLSSYNITLARRSLFNFVLMSLLFSANHGCVVACLSLATARLGSTGAWQSGMLYLSYTASAVLGATYVVKKLGARNALMTGMTLYCFYVGCFWVATLGSPSVQTPVALLGAATGGVGAGFLWTAQGSYFGRAAEDHASDLRQAVSVSNSTFASIFAFLYLAEEVGLRALSTLLLQFGWQWTVVFGIYTIIAVVSTLLMVFVYDYSSATEDTEDNHQYDHHDNDDNQQQLPSSSPTNTHINTSVYYKVTAAWQLLRNDPKMKHMIGLNAVFGLTAAFLNSYINGEVVRASLHDDESKYVGIFNALVSCVAALMSLVFGRLAPKIGNGPVLILGAICFFGVVFPFVVLPDTHKWNVPLLVMVYSLHGTGRATFEGTLKATFADFFAYEKEGAFANIILQNGLSGAIGYILTFTLLCSQESRYCIRYSDGSLHDVLSFELLVIAAAILAIVGYWKAAALHRDEVRDHPETLAQTEEDTAMLSSSPAGENSH